MRARLAIPLLALVVALAGACGPTGPGEEGGDPVDPVALLSVLPSPGDLRGAPAEPAGAEELQRALTGPPDPAIAARLRGRGLREAAVRRWEAPGGAVMEASVSVWPSRLLASGIGADAARALTGSEGWTPSELRGSRGARLDEGGRRELRLSDAVGPNLLYVRAEGPVPDDVVARQLRRLVQTAQGGAF